MLTKVKTQQKVKTWIRPYSQVKLDRMTEGWMKRLRELGYDVPFRFVKPRNRKAPLKMPWFLRLEMRVVVGSDVVLCQNPVPGMLDMADVSMLDERDWYGRPILGPVVSMSKVRQAGRSVVISIKKPAQAVLGNVLWRYLDFGLTNYPGKVTLKIFETEAPACSLATKLPECLRRWPVPVLDAAAAWRIAFEPFREARANTWLPPKYAKRDPRNLDRAAAFNEIMMATADMQAELRKVAVGEPD
jgi:hypothetical protein